MEASRQFEHGPETPWTLPVDFGTSYRVTAPTSDQRYFAPGAEVRVSHPSTWYDYKFQGSMDRIDQRGDLTRYQFGDRSDGQRALFGVRHTHPYVSWMSTHRDYRAHIPSLLGAAAVETRARFGEPLRSDRSLSETSSPIVHRLAQAGAVQVPKMENRNSHQVDPDAEFSTRESASAYVREVPAETVHLGKQFLRHALRQPKRNVSRGRVSSGLKDKQGKLFD